MANLLQMAQQVTQRQGSSNANPSFNDMVSMAKAAGSPQAAMAQIAKSGMTVNVGGRSLDINQFSQMMQGKTPEQAARELGIDPGVLGYIR